MPSKEATAKAVDIMQTVFYWDEARCLSDSGRVAIGQIGDKLDEFAAEAKPHPAGPYKLVHNTMWDQMRESVARAEAAERRVAELEAVLLIRDNMVAELLDAAALAAPKEGGDGE